jgi:hypothetical protein
MAHKSHPADEVTDEMVTEASEMKLECPNCGSEYPDLPADTTEHHARLALRAVLLWYEESPIREIQMADAACGIKFPIKAIEAALLPNGARESTENKG